ncbi:rhodanese-like domain-containing protein [Patescibacteria group bacterium]
MNKILPIIIVLIVLSFAYYFLKPETPPTQLAETEIIMDEKTETTMEKSIPEDEEMEVDYVDISPMEAQELIDSNPDLVILDVSNRYNEGHLPGAMNYYVGDGSLDEAIPTLDEEATYLVYCHVDSAAIAGAQKLIDAGFEKVYRLEGNYSAWVNAGYDVEM